MARPEFLKKLGVRIAQVESKPVQMLSGSEPSQFDQIFALAESLGFPPVAFIQSEAGTRRMQSGREAYGRLADPAYVEYLPLILVALQRHELERVLEQQA